MLTSIGTLKVLSLAMLIASATWAQERNAPQDTLAKRLASFKHVGFSEGRAFGSPPFRTEPFILRTYTDRQQARNLQWQVEMAKSHEDMRSRRDANSALLAAAKDKDEIQRLVEEKGALREKRDELDRLWSTRGTSSLAYFTIVSVGEDYLELKPATGKGPHRLIPFRLVAQVMLPEAEDETPAP